MLTLFLHNKIAYYMIISYFVFFISTNQTPLLFYRAEYPV